MQPDDDTYLRPVSYCRRTLCSDERNYDTTESDCLAIVWAVLLLRPYLHQDKFLVRTDYSTLQ